MTQMIPLTKGYFAIVDDEDFERVSQYKWYAHIGESSGPYARQYPIGQMHRLILDAPPHLYVDHIDGNGLNNRRSNLRLCTKGQNAANSILPSTNRSGFRGVWLHRPLQKWRAGIRFQGRNISLGCFDDPIEAARAYDAKALELFGEFARLNFPQEVSK